MLIALFENFGSDFYGARLGYAKFLKSQGHNVIAIVPDDGWCDRIQEEGIDVLPTSKNGRSKGVFGLLNYYRKTSTILRENNFDVVHSFRFHPNLLIALYRSLNFKIRFKHVAHITGVGMVFSYHSARHKFLQIIYRGLYQFVASGKNVDCIVQNEYDAIDLRLSDAHVIKGSTANEEIFSYHPFPTDGDVRILLVSRLLRSKGIRELVGGFQLFRERCPNSKLLIAGWIDPSNSDSFTEDEINEFSRIEGVEFLGKRSDVSQLIQNSSLCALPTRYREGTPRFLLESMCVGRPILTTNAPGCSHLVDGSNGVLIDSVESSEIFKALVKMQAMSLERMGKASRRLYEESFSRAVVFPEFLNTYKD